MEQGIFRLHGVVQHYAWGGFDFIPELIGQENTDQQPFAELWMGAHQRGPAKIELPDRQITLAEFIATDPQRILGNRALKKFGESLPYLFKVLDVNKMLSIQSHPTKAAAVAGFAAENDKGVPLTARHRNYKDDNHKPEVMVALTDFYLLHGFRPIKEIEEVLKTIPELKALQAQFVDQNIKRLYQTVMEMPQEEINEMLTPMKARLLPQFDAGNLSKERADYWAALAFKDYPNNCDRGIFSIYFFNLVKIEKGSGIFQDAGVPHAYLEGVNMELMANSDNVFRGGLTPKHIDVGELMQHLVFDSVNPQILEGETFGITEKKFITPAPDFQLTQITVDRLKVHSCIAQSPQTLIVMNGSVSFNEGDNKIDIKRGETVFILPSTSYSIEGEGVIFRAEIP